MRRAVRTHGRAVGIIEFAGVRAANFGKNAVQGLNAGSAIWWTGIKTPRLGQRRSRKTDGQSRYQKNKAQAHGRFLAFFK